jgi:hypothetical protein
MSKPIARIFFSVLIALVLVAGVYTSVYGAMLNPSTKSAQVYIDSSIKLGMLHNQSSTQNLDSSGLQARSYREPPYGCNHDSQINPEDY